MLSAALMGGFIACTTTGIKPLEQMTELEYSKWKVYIQLGVKIGASHLLNKNIVTQEQLNIASTAIAGINQPATDGAKSLIIPALRKAGFNNDEVEFIRLIAEQELLARGALDWINPETGTLELSPRTKEILQIVSDALRTANLVTDVEKTQASAMNADFCQSAVHDPSVK